jgi:type IV pilus assembly protein PilV
MINRFSRDKQTGATLIEVLITIVIFSMGLVSIGLLTAQSLATADDALLRSQAVLISQDIVDRIRVNDQVVSDYATMFSDAPSGSQRCLNTPCLATQLVAADLFDWKSKLQVLLPEGRGQVEVSGDDVLVSVEWNMRGEYQNFQLRFNM